MKQALIHGLCAGALSGLAANIFNTAYSEALLVDFSLVIHPIGITAACMFSCLLASLGYFLLGKWITRGLNPLFNALFLIITFATFVGPFAISLPYEVEFPELFPGLALPLHMFPVAFWLATKSLFYK